ncbi:uncharacterized protein LOC111386761 [Olea europaea var. sylvestris]|uniref:Uncharacterized protein n=1 Tax=Olea europaea subsp. europaea TaxID=158383 RepID=A0A8S0PIX9_OLEEU|nr:uncharacterized protein LOC111386761 [Olea europaea var. sylvestris]XP_022866995.1 uncharacterized protein LOC111386761 [Olea europaea var. sylvestris]CAA2953783.1 Hypothetical predicted protein [Olea europaea subsp. europaea]
METAPIKSKPLHNFSLPQLKWAHKNSTSQYHRVRRHDSPDNRQPIPDTYSEIRVVKTGTEQLHSIPKSPPQMGVVCAEEENWGCKEWYLRPRKEVKAAAAKKETSVENSRINSTTSALKSSRLRGWAEGGEPSGGLGMGFGVERKEKMKIWISLSREEIDDDVYALTGSKPARRPKKRSKNIQKQLDGVFPGLYLVGLTADSYRVHDALRYM